jgi:N-acetyl-gamma-glutamylphosphate reductase
MSNAGKLMINWKRDFPELRAALGMLGREGYTGTDSANFLLTHAEMKSVVDHSQRVCGRALTKDAILSRLAKHYELAALEDQNPAAYRRGRVIFNRLLPQMQKAYLARNRV